MTTLSVPLNKKLEEKLNELVENGVGPNKAAVMRRALDRLAEEEAVNAVLKAEREPSLSGDLSELAQEL